MQHPDQRLDEASRRRFGATFADPAVVRAYAARPSYPVEAVRWLVGSGRREVVDLGAGSGKLTEVLVELGHDVVAVDPSAAMLASLGARLPSVRTARGAAEDLPLPDRCCEVVTVAQAFHWFDPRPALAEITRVLRPGGRLGLVWNVRDERVPVGADLSEVFGGLHARHETTEDLAASPSFGPVEEARFASSQRLDRRGLRELVQSRSYAAVLDEDALTAVLARVDAAFDRHAVDDLITIPYVTRCFRANVSG